ncbi:MAG: hypothetical protein EOM21_20285 [Gammaproteobacteria bacterium]|nr:hypothetical protein [Gammaproteobacteria bacterium]
MNATIMPFAAALLSSCATAYVPEPLPAPSLRETCSKTTELFLEAQGEVERLGRACLAGRAGSQVCDSFFYGLKLIVDSGITDGVMLCLKSGSVDSLDSDRIRASIERVQPMVDRQQKRMK